MERLVVWHRAVPRARGAADPAVVSAWSKAVAARFSAAGGTVLAHVSGTAVASFEAGEVADVLDLVLDLLDEADDGPLAVSFGAAASTIEEVGGVSTGAAIEAAESLAVRAHPGEIVLDPAARERARGLFLFARQVGAGPAASKAASVDRSHPRRDSSEIAMSRLGPVPLAPATAALLPTLESALRDPGSLTVLRGPVGAGTVELLRAAQTNLAPARVIELGGASAGVAPLGSIRSALTRELDLEAFVAGAPDDARALLASVTKGELPAYDALLGALAEVVDAATGTVWIVLTPLGSVDAATLAVVAALHRARPTTVVLVVRHAVDAPLPAIFADAPRVELTLPPLRTGDARVIAQSVLGEGTDPDVARRVAVLGGDTSLGVLEAARAMIGAGDLVLEDDRFAWRSAPRGGVRAVALDALIAERLELLDDESRRVLEAIAVLPDGAPRSIVDRSLASDGVRPRSIARGMERLALEGWIDPHGKSDTPRPVSSFLRRFVVSALPPARAAELHRFAAASFEADAKDDAEPPALVAERALQLLEGGCEEEAAAMLVPIAKLLAERGHGPSALQLALVVIRSGAMGDGRTAAAALARELAPGRSETEPPPAPSTLHAALPPLELEPTAPTTEERALADDDEPDLVAEVRDAIRRRDYEGLERLAERAMAEGSDMAAVARLRALAAALRGDLAGAQRRLDRARAQKMPRDRRALLAEAMVALRGGRAPAAVRLALSALADARRASDERGEAVALFTLAACFRALGRPNDAALLESRVDA